MERLTKIKINGEEYNIGGDSVFIRYSANADGADFTEGWSEGQNYIGFATAQEAPADKSGYTWVLFVKTANISSLEKRVKALEDTLKDIETALSEI